jgi:hypothetical protein
LEDRVGPLGYKQAFGREFDVILREWPEGTGNPEYPVPDPEDDLKTFDRAVYRYGVMGDIWNPACPYGMLRLRLTAYVAGRFTALAIQSD